MTRPLPLVRDGEQTTATLTWWHHGWQSYALRLTGPAGVVEAVEDNWFAALSSLSRELAPTGWHLAVPVPLPGPAEDHHGQWLNWLDTLSR